MDFSTIVLSLLFGLAFIHGLTTLKRKLKKLPPGPAPLPIIGNLHHMLGGERHTVLNKLVKAYGPIVSLKLGSITTVIVSSPSIAKEILQKKDLAFSSKKVPSVLTAHDHYKHSVAWLPANTEWKSYRKIMASNIFTHHSLEVNQHIRLKKVQELIDYCRTSGEAGQAVEIGDAAFRTTLNILSNIIFSKDLVDYHSQEAKEFKDTIWNILYEVAKPNLGDFFPVLRVFDIQGIKGRISNHIGKALSVFDALVKERLEQRRSNGPSNNDVLDVFLNYCEEHPDEIDAKDIKHTFLDLFIGGTDATSSAIEWSMAELIKNPMMMEKAKGELGEVVGKGKLIEETDIPNLRFMSCVVKETLRKHPPGPFLFPRKTEEDVEVCGYTIPKDSQVLINIWAIMRDSSLWENPLAFKPERFEESDLDIRGHNFELIPFGAGRRMCPGLSLGMKMVPLMLGSLVNSFDWKLEDGLAPEELNFGEKVGHAAQMAHALRAIPVSI